MRICSFFGILYWCACGVVVGMRCFKILQRECGSLDFKGGGVPDRIGPRLAMEKNRVNKQGEKAEDLEDVFAICLP